MLTPERLAQIEADYAAGRRDHRTVRELLTEVRELQPTEAQQAALQAALEALAVCATGDLWKLAQVDREAMRAAGMVVRGMVGQSESEQDEAVLPE